MDAKQPRQRESLVHRTSRLVGTINLPLAGRRFLPAYALLHHRGRRSGKPYTVPVWARTTADGVVIPMMFGERTEWAHNVMAAGSCTLRWRGEDLLLTDPEVAGPELVTAFNRVQRWGLRVRGVRQYMRLRPVS